MTVPSLAPTILLSSLLGPGGVPDSRTRFAPQGEIIPAPSDDPRARDAESH